MAHEARRNMQNSCLSVDEDAACHVGIVMMEVINLAEMSEYFARYCWLFQRRNQFCPVKQMAKIRPFICSASSDRRTLSILISATEQLQLRHHHHRRQHHHLYSTKEVSGDLLFLLSCMEMKDLVLWPENFFKLKRMNSVFIWSTVFTEIHYLVLPLWTASFVDIREHNRPLLYIWQTQNGK